MFRGRSLFNAARSFRQISNSPLILMSSQRFYTTTSTATNSWKHRATMAGLGTAAVSYGLYNVNKSYCDALEEDQKRKDQGTPISESDNMRLRMESFVRDLQKRIVTDIEAVEGSEGKKFLVDNWTRAEGGGGTTCILQDGKVFEKAGVGISVITGHLSETAVQQMRHRSGKEIGGEDGKPVAFFAAGISLVMHPHNPNAPTVHMNYRYFEIPDENEKNGGAPKVWWFGGGADLTPSYLFEEDAIHFHQTLKDGCDKHDSTYYSKYKKWCDVYFLNKHRNETRGIGGIFFDDLDNKPPAEIFEFVKEMGYRFSPSYVPIMEKRKDMPFTQHMKDYQQIRRGRYVEFNLVWDRGTKFGFNTPGARIESILMSLPLTARWEYMRETEVGSKESVLEEVLKNPRNWVPLD